MNINEHLYLSESQIAGAGTFVFNIYVLHVYYPLFSWGFSEGGLLQPIRIINIEGHITLNLLPVYRYGHPIPIDTKLKTYDLYEHALENYEMVILCVKYQQKLIFT